MLDMCGKSWIVRARYGQDPRPFLGSSSAKLFHIHLGEFRFQGGAQAGEERKVDFLSKPVGKQSICGLVHLGGTSLLEVVGVEECQRLTFLSDGYNAAGLHLGRV